jgi:hypothetical protein
MPQSQRKLKLVVGSPVHEEPTHYVNQHRRRYPGKSPAIRERRSDKGKEKVDTRAALVAGVKALSADAKINMLREYQKVTDELHKTNTDKIKADVAKLEKELKDAGVNYYRITRSQLSPPKDTSSKRTIEAQEDEDAVKQSLESAFGSSSNAPKTPKERQHKRFKSDAISPGLPPCGGSGNKSSHAHVLMSDDDDE